jgi:hypothetical protein
VFWLVAPIAQERARLAARARTHARNDIHKQHEEKLIRGFMRTGRNSLDFLSMIERTD